MTMNRPARLAMSAVIVTVVVLAFLPSLSNGFTNWDDDQYVADNPLARSWSGSALIRIFTTPYAQVYAPLTFVSYALEYRLYRLKPFGYHLTNLALHLINSLLAFCVFMLLSRNRWVAGLTALFFAIHPLRVESVAWIAERKDVLYAAFYLAALAVYARPRDRFGAGSYAAVTLLFLLSLLSKPMAVTLPAVLLLIDFDRGVKIDFRRIIYPISLGLMSAAFIIINYYAQRPAPVQLADLIRHIAVGSYSVLFCLAKTILPIRLSAFYPFPSGYPDRVPWTMPAAVLALAALAVLIVRFRRRRPLLFGGLWFLIAVFPVSQFIPLPGPAMTADRFTYLAALGPAYAAAWGLVALGRVWAARRLRIAPAAAAIAVIVTLAGSTAVRCRVWHSGIALWNDVIAKYPGVALAYDNRGILRAQAGQARPALADFNRALAIDPRLVKAYYNRGLLRYQTGDRKGSLDDLNRAIALNPLNPRFFNTRGIIHTELGDNLGAYEDFTAALALDPHFTEAYNNRGNVRQGSGDLRGALADFDRALAIDPRFADAYYNRAVTRFWLKDFSGARADLQRFEMLGGSVPPEFYRDLDRGQSGSPSN